jgi:hypothetical protein
MRNNHDYLTTKALKGFGGFLIGKGGIMLNE